MLGFGLFTFQIKAVIGGNQGQLHFLSEIVQLPVQFLLAFKTVILKFQVEASLEHITIPACQPSGFIHPAVEQGLGNHPFKAAAEGDQSLVVLFEGGFINTWQSILLAFRKGMMGKVGQAPVSFPVEADQLGLGGAPGDTRPAVLRLRSGCKKTHPDQRFEARLFHAMIEFHCPVHVAVVGDGTGIETLLLEGGGQLWNLDCAFQQGILGMEVQVCEHRQQLISSVSNFRGQARTKI